MNLISARCYGIELDIEDVCAMLSARRGDGADGADFARYESLLLAVLVHAWPLPTDPVIVALRSTAKLALKTLEKFRAPPVFNGVAAGG